MTWEDAALWAILAAAPGQVVFAATWFLLSPWWTSFVGRALMWKSSALAVVLTIIFVAYLWEVPIPRPVAALAYGSVCIGVYLQLAAFLLIRFGSEGAPEQTGLWHMATRRLRSR